MRNKIRFICIIATIAASIVFSRTVSAVPSLFIDDSNPTTIHIYASDMNLTINGQSNTGSVPLSITLPDGQYYFSAYWWGSGNSAVTNLEFALPSDPTLITSGISVTQFIFNGSASYLNGYISAYNPPTTYGTTNSQTQLQDGHEASMTQPTLEIYFTSETPINPVPEPTTMLLLGFGLVGLAGVRRMRN